jgi:DNA-binding response OmpR family regulator
METEIAANEKKRAWASADSPVLVVCANGPANSQLRQALKSIGYVKVTAASSHVQGLDRAKDRNFAMIFFDAEASDMPAVDFVTAVAALEDGSTLIALSAQPRVDDIFSLLRSGAKGFLVTPFNVDSLEAVVKRAQEGPPLSFAVLSAPDRNAALAGVILNNLYRLSVMMRQAREFPTAARDVAKQNYALCESVDLAKLFCEASEQALTEKIVELCVDRASVASSRLGRTRKKLQAKRTGSEIDTAEDQA